MEPTSDEALLTAYLDGELSPQDRQRLEQRLANEPELRQRLTVLEETWHYLDLLERESVDTEKIETTMRIAAVSVSGVPFMSPKVSRFGQWSTAFIAGLALFVVTFYLGKRAPLDDPSYQQMVERLDMYLAIADDDEITLLKLLAEKRVFLPNDTPLIDLYEHKPTSRANNAELYQLCYRNSQRFLELPKEKQKRIRKLHHDIEMEPAHIELPLTLQNYAYWHKSLQAYERKELAKSASLDEKAANIIALKTRLDRLLPDDALLMPSEIVGIEESRYLAEVLAKLSSWQKVDILSKAPILIVNELKQLPENY